jgi:phosphopantetheinyl transferase
MPLEAGSNELMRLRRHRPQHLPQRAEQLVALALSDSCQVGVDVEPAACGDADPIVWSALSASERACLERLPPPERARWFLRMWTLKEAFVKCAGACLPFDWLALAASPRTG